VVVFNPLAQPRDEVLEIEVALPKPSKAAAVEIVDDRGRVCECQIMERKDDSLFVDNVWDVPTYTGVNRFRLLAAFESLPPLGYRTYTVREVARAPEAASSLSSNVLENEHIRVEVRPDGTVDLHDKRNDRRYPGVNYYLDQGEAGNAGATRRRRTMRCSKAADGRRRSSALRADRWRARSVRGVMDLPADGGDGTTRSARRVPFAIETYYTVFKGDPRLHVRVEFDNCVRDHWLRAVFPTGIRTDVVHADTHFDIVERLIAHPDDTGWIEPYLGTAPMHGMVALSDGRAGLAVLTEGLFEYEVFDDERRAIALSLVRSFPIKLQVSEEKKEVLPDTGVQCPGLQSFRYAILRLPRRSGGRRAAGGPAIRQSAARCTGYPRRGSLPREFSLLRVEGQGLVVTAVKRCETRTIGSCGCSTATRKRGPGTWVRLARCLGSDGATGRVGHRRTARSRQRRGSDRAAQENRNADGETVWHG